MRTKILYSIDMVTYFLIFQELERQSNVLVICHEVRINVVSANTALGSTENATISLSTLFRGKQKYWSHCWFHPRTKTSEPYCITKQKTMYNPN